MTHLAGKKLLVLGGANQHEKFVEAAKKMGVISYVADYLETSKAKASADHAVQIDIKDLDSLEILCRQERIDGVVAAWLDPCQLPYLELCNRLAVPCYGTVEQFEVLTNKGRFKRLCAQYGVDTIESYTLCDLDEIVYPVFVKPAESRGSRGQHEVCGRAELYAAIEDAKAQSIDGEVVIERLMKGYPDISATYFFIDGVAYLERLSDRLLGSRDDHLGNVAIGTYSPSVYSELYMAKVNDKVVTMLNALGIQNGPVFMQGFVDDDTVRFYDPGFRFPGGEYERAVDRVFGVDFAKLLIEYALSGRILSWSSELPSDLFNLNGATEIIHDVSLSPGVIASIEGIERVKALPGIVSLSQRYFAGNAVPNEANVGRRFLEINMLCQNLDEARSLVAEVNNLVHVYSTDGADMVISRLNPDSIGRQHI